MIHSFLGLIPAREPFPAAAVLEEHDNDLGVLIWSSLRAADLWIEAGTAEGLFSPRAERARVARIDALGAMEAPLSEALAVMAGILASPAVHARQLASACAQLAQWADDGGWVRTAFEAAARAAVIDPRDPRHALLAGTMARRAADHCRAHGWLVRAERLARRAGDGLSHANALLAAAQIHMVRGERGPAETTLRRAIRSARRHGAWEVKPRAYHDLFCIQCTDGDVRTAAAYALAAAEGYGLHHHLLLALAHDVALFLSMHGRAPHVLPLLEALVVRTASFPRRLIAFSSLGRVAGLAGDRVRFAAAWSGVWTRLDRRVSEDRAAEALINLAWGAAYLDDLQRLEIAASEALRIATPREEWNEVRAAEEFLRAIDRGSVPDCPAAVWSSDDDLRDGLAAAELILQQLLRTPAMRNVPRIAAPDVTP